MKSSRQSLRCKPASAGWWLRCLATALCLFSANYALFHLAAESHHLVDQDAASSDAAQAQVSNFSPATHDDHGHHVPHLASDHLLRFALQASSQSVSLALVLADTRVALPTPRVGQPLFLTERQNPPGIPPPDPLQPRAPPLV